MTTDLRRISARAIGLLVGVLALLTLNVGPASTAATAGTVLIYGPSMQNLTPNERTVAEGQGHAVTVVTEAEWAAMSIDQFAAFDALVIGDAGCDSDESLLDGATANRATWSAAVTGNVTVNTFDPFAHTGDPADQTEELVANSIDFAAAQPGTGFYFSLGCYFESDGDSQTLTLMDRFGPFTVDGEWGDEVTIVEPGHPVMSGLTNVGLSDWGSSVHSHFVSFPPSFQMLALETETVPDRAVALAMLPPTCKGEPATIFGGPADDELIGTPDRDVIAGLGGADLIQGQGGKDLLCGDEGGDRLKGGGGGDLLLGGVGRDFLAGGPKRDVLRGQQGRDFLAGGPGKGDLCKGGPKKDVLRPNCERGRA